MTDVLILGGTGWLSGRIAAHALGAGATVTCLARGGRPAPPGATLVLADRDEEDAYDVVSRTDWDHVVDVSSRAAHVSAAVRALGDRAVRWTYVSSMSLSRDDGTVGTDESAPRHPAAPSGEDDDYARQKVAAEDAVQEGIGDRALVLRPGLIVGDGDPSDRFGYWAAAFLRALDEPVLVPPLDGRCTQVIDVEDIAAFVVSSSATGPVNAIGDVRDLEDVLRTVRAATGHAGPVVVGTEERLVAEGVAYWAGPRSLPLWLPPEMRGFMTRSNARYRDSGGLLRPLDETVERVVADERERGVDRARRAGPTRTAERAPPDALAR